MPIVKNSTYRPPFFLRSAHLNTIYPGIIRTVKGVEYERQILETPDDDFVALDWSKVGSRRLIIALHGLEGSADRPYIRGMIKIFNQNGWDGIGFNHRGCSGEPNRQLCSYHMGQTEDLRYLIQQLATAENYDEIALVGFSLGGNVVLKYLGEEGEQLPKIVQKAVAFSVPCDLTTANVEIDKFKNRLYRQRFLDSLNEKVLLKKQYFNDQLQIPNPLPKNFAEFDDIFTGPIHGFADAKDYWIKSSSLAYLPKIHIPTLLVNALDDTFLSKSCYPYALADQHPFLHLETPTYGGHVGFTTFSKDGYFWSERRAYEFVSS